MAVKVSAQSIVTKEASPVSPIVAPSARPTDSVVKRLATMGLSPRLIPVSPSTKVLVHVMPPSKATEVNAPLAAARLALAQHERTAPIAPRGAASTALKIAYAKASSAYLTTLDKLETAVTKLEGSDKGNDLGYDIRYSARPVDRLKAGGDYTVIATAYGKRGNMSMTTNVTSHCAIRNVNGSPMLFQAAMDGAVYLIVTFEQAQSDSEWLRIAVTDGIKEWFTALAASVGTSPVLDGSGK